VLEAEKNGPAGTIANEARPFTVVRVWSLFWLSTSSTAAPFTTRMLQVRGLGNEWIGRSSGRYELEVLHHGRGASTVIGISGVRPDRVERGGRSARDLLE
jgi:hypothetical protein